MSYGMDHKISRFNDTLYSSSSGEEARPFSYGDECPKVIEQIRNGDVPSSEELESLVILQDSRLEKSFTEKSLEKGCFSALADALRGRDVNNLSQVDIDTRIIYETLRDLEQLGKVEFKFNERMFKVTPIGEDIGTNLKSFTLHINLTIYTNKPVYKNRLEKNEPRKCTKLDQQKFLGFIKTCGLDLEEVNNYRA